MGKKLTLLLLFFTFQLPLTSSDTPTIGAERVEHQTLSLERSLQLLDDPTYQIGKKNGRTSLYNQLDSLSIPLSEIFNKTNWSSIEATPSLKKIYKQLIIPQSIQEIETEERIAKTIMESLKVDTLSIEEVLALRLYTSLDQNDYYKKINTLLREEVIDNPLDEEETVVKNTLFHIYMTASALNKLKPYQFSGTLYRSIELPSHLVKQFIEGKVFTEYAFTSSSRKIYDPNQCNVRLIIEGRSGLAIDTISKTPHQKEVLFLPHTPFNVTKIKKECNGNYSIFLEENLKSEVKG